MEGCTQLGSGNIALGEFSRQGNAGGAQPSTSGVQIGVPFHGHQAGTDASGQPNLLPGRFDLKTNS